MISFEKTIGSLKVDLVNFQNNFFKKLNLNSVRLCVNLSSQIIFNNVEIISN